MKKIQFIVLVFCLLFALASICHKPLVFKIDHFKVYTVDTLEVAQPFQVMLQDQFDTAPKPGNLLFIEYFANPVSKNGQNIIDPNAHLTWCSLMDHPPEMPRTVKIRNQFGTFRWKLGKPVYLLVPTQKIEPDSHFPEQLDHFKCYEVTAVEVLQRRVTLVDQFDKKLEQKEEVIVDKPLFFGVPVMKNEKEIINKVDHLACYHISSQPGPTPPQPMNVAIRNQFGEYKLTARKSYMLCVPSKKYLLKEGEE